MTLKQQRIKQKDKKFFFSFEGETDFYLYKYICVFSLKIITSIQTFILFFFLGGTKKKDLKSLNDKNKPSRRFVSFI